MSIIFFLFFSIYLKIHCQNCQDNPLSRDPFSLFNHITQMQTQVRFRALTTQGLRPKQAPEKYIRIWAQTNTDRITLII
jgi:hypothetical protein